MPLTRRSALGLMVMNTLAASTGAHAQLTPAPKSPISPSSSPSATSPFPEINGTRQADESNAGPMSERMKISAEKAHNDDRRKRMLADTDKLLALSTELKGDIEKSTKDQLSMDVIRKAIEIEKLAHDVQQRMKN